MNLIRFVTLIAGGGLSIPTAVLDARVAHYDRNTSDLWQDTAQTTVSGVGDPLGSWDDITSNERDAQQGSTTVKPTTQAGYINFDGGDQLEATFPTATLMTAFVVASFDVSSDTTQGLIDWATGAVNTGFAILHDTTLKARVGSTVTADTSTDYRTGVTYVFTMRFDGDGDLILRANGSEIASNNGSGHGNTLSSFRIGNLHAAFTMQGRVSEVIMCGDAVSDADMATTETVLMNKWGLS